jgi:hypothetical protein
MPLNLCYDRFGHWRRCGGAGDKSAAGCFTPGRRRDDAPVGPLAQGRSRNRRRAIIGRPSRFCCKARRPTRRAARSRGRRVGALRLRYTLVSHQRMEPVMKILALTVALLFAASPVAAQQTQQALGTNCQINTSTLPNTGVICQEEMVATFCNVATGPNNAGYGTHGGAAATSTGITTPSKAIPACGEGLVPANELCN